MRKYKAKISYTMDKDHPDKDYVVGGWKEYKRYDFEDTYTFTDMYDNVDKKEIYSHIKHDLMLVAGGGYNTDHIHDVVFEISVIKNTYTWDDLYQNADDKGYGSPELTAKDEVRWQVKNFVLEKTNVDLEEAECPEDEIFWYTTKYHIVFDETGNIIEADDYGDNE